MQIIVRKKGTEQERKKRETAQSILKHYYNREVRDGAKARFPVSKDSIKKVYQ